jgi:hypothetical protein
MDGKKLTKHQIRPKATCRTKATFAPTLKMSLSENSAPVSKKGYFFASVRRKQSNRGPAKSTTSQQGDFLGLRSSAELQVVPT